MGSQSPGCVTFRRANHEGVVECGPPSSKIGIEASEQGRAAAAEAHLRSMGFGISTEREFEAG